MFWTLNAGMAFLMALLILRFWTLLASADIGQPGDPEHTRTVIGLTRASGMFLFVWGCGAVITGLLALLTRGRKTYIEERLD